MQRGGHRLVRAAVVVAVLGVVLPLLWIPSLVLGILLLVRRRVAIGVGVLVIGVFIAPGIGLELYRAFVLQPFTARSQSMEPAVRLGERFVVLKLGRSGELGDVVVLRVPAGALESRCATEPPAGAMCARATPQLSETTFVMRVVAVGGDRISMRGGRVIRNGRPERTQGLSPCDADGCDFPREIAVPAGQVFVLGDNRGGSDDSRFWGPVPREAIVGRRWFTYAGG